MIFNKVGQQEKNMNNDKVDNFMEKIRRFENKNRFDLSADEDLSIAIMNLVSLEEHFFFTGSKSGKEKYFDLLGKIREMRKELLKRIIKDSEGEVWCISKHLLAASMRLIEVGTKYQSQGKKKEAKDMYYKAYDLYSLFWGITLQIIEIGEVKKIDDNQINKEDKGKEDLTKRLNKLVQDLINCCEE